MDNDQAVRAGFDWLMREVQLPDDAARQALFMASASAFVEGHEKAVRTISRAWPREARWPSGEAFLRSRGWLPEDEISDCDDAADYNGPGLVDLFVGRLIHVKHRLQRDSQVRALFDRSSGRSRGWPTHIIVNRDYWQDDEPCGMGCDRVVSIEEGLALMAEPAHPHPECRCTFDAHPTPGWSNEGSVSDD